MPTTALFISHSSKTPEDRTRVEKLRDLLKDAGYHVMLDRRVIKVGNEWRQKIHRMLARCHAGVILFNRDALASPWVLKEATILSVRAALEKPRFRLAPILLGKIKGSDITDGPFKPLQLGEIQHVHEADAQSIASQIIEGFEIPTQVNMRTPYDELIDAIADELEEIGDRKLRRIAEQSVDDAVELLGEDWQARFADLLARRIFQAGPHGLSRAVEVLARMPRVDESIRKNVVSILEPMWVEGDAAALLPGAVEKQSGYRDLALCCREPFFDFVAPRYVDRGYLLKGQKRLWGVEDASGGNLAAHVIGAMRDRLRQEPLYENDDVKTLDDTLKSYKHPFFVLLPSIADDAALEELRAKYENVTFLMHTTETLPSRRELPAGVRYVDPELKPEDEKAAKDAQAEANEFVAGN